MSTQTRTRQLATATLLAWWVVIAWRMWVHARHDPGPTGLPGDLPNLHNRPGDLSRYLVITVVELAVVLLILRPWSYERSVVRALIALLLLCAWMLPFMISLIHAGGVAALHFFWLFALVLGLLVLSLVSWRSRARFLSKDG